MLFREQVPLAPFTTFKIGGPARWFAEAATEADLPEAVEFARSRGLAFFVLGGGSNLLVSDAGFPGLVIHIALRGTSEEADGSDRVLSVGAGEVWDELVDRAVSRNYSGIESLTGIPGTVGGTPVQNVGAYGQEVATTIQDVRALDTLSGKFVDLNHEECGFGYRKSIFNTTHRGRYIVSRVTFRLISGGMATVSYPDVKHYLGDGPQPISEIRRAVREVRSRKGMLITPGDPDSLSAGSFFKNPVLPIEAIGRIQEAAGESSNIPQYPAGEGKVKIAAAWLVEQAGFCKGLELGRAGISSRHSLALINRGGATAADIAALRDAIIAAVKDRFGIALEPEPVWVA